MSTLSSSLNASASCVVADFYIPATRHQRSPRYYLAVARRATLAWGLVQILVTFAAVRLSGRIVDEVLGIASFTNGLILGIFLLGLAGYRRHTTAYTGIAGGAVVMLGIRLLTAVSWQWYVLAGATATFAAGCVADGVRETQSWPGFPPGSPSPRQADTAGLFSQPRYAGARLLERACRGESAKPTNEI